MNEWMEWMLSWTALSNLHPALVHFPLALACVALALDAWVVLRGAGGADRSAAGLGAAPVGEDRALLVLPAGFDDVRVAAR